MMTHRSLNLLDFDSQTDVVSFGFRGLNDDCRSEVEQAQGPVHPETGPTP